MTYVPDSSREIVSALNTPAQLRAAIAKLLSALRSDRTDIDVLIEDVATLLSATRRPAIANEAVSLGDVLRLASADHVAKAQADAVANVVDLCGVCTKTAPSGGATEYCPLGIVEKPAWGLTVGDTYFLSAATAGLLTATAPSTTGQIVRIIGVALSTTELLVNPAQGVLL